MIEIENVHFRYGEDDETPSCLRNINLTIRRGEFVVLCGKSGCGKTTLTRLINGLIPHYYEGHFEGSVRVDGKDVNVQPLSKTAKQVGSVFQNPRSQFFNVDTTSELAFGCENIALSIDEIRRRIENTSEMFTLERLIGRNIFELSGGEKQRIACASVYAVGPDVFVLDEPSSNLDAASVKQLQNVLATLKSSGKTIAVSEHRLHYLTELADRYIYLEGGKIAREFSSEEMQAMGSQKLSDMGLRALELGGLNQDNAPVPIHSAGEIVIEDMLCRYGRDKEPVLDIPRLTLPTGEIIAVIGNNGAGKSTFAGCVSGITKCKGKVSFNGKSFSAKERLQQSYMVMQDVNHQLFTESVSEELMLNIPEDRKAFCSEILDALGLSANTETHPLALSGGEKQRVAIGSAVCAGKEILIYDEPTSGQDLINMRVTCTLIQKAAENALTSFVITHDLEFILNCCTVVLHISNGKVAELYQLDGVGINKVKKYFLENREEEKPLKKGKKKSALSRLMGYADGYKKLTITGCTLSGLAALLGLAPYICVWLVVREVLAIFPDFSAATDLTKWGWAALWFALANVIVYFAALMCTHAAAFRTARNMRKTAMQHVAKLPLGFFTAGQTGTLRKQIDDNAGMTEDILAHKLPDLTAAIVTPIAAIFLLFRFDWLMGLLCLLTMILALADMMLMMRGENQGFFHRYQREIEKMSGEAVEYVRGIPVVKVFQQTVYSFKAFYAAIMSYSDLAGQYAMSCRKGQTFFLTLIHGAFVLLIPAALFRASGGDGWTALANFIFYAMFAPACGGMINRIMYVSQSVMEANESTMKLDAILQQQPLSQTASPKQPKGADVEFKDVTFAYPGTDRSALQNVSFLASKGQTVALIGPSGGGKTTAASLIPRFWDAQSGAVLVGGVDVREMDSAALMKHVAFVFQDTRLFKKSLLENITASRPGATREEALAAASAAQCDDIFEKLPDGIDTVVGTRGIYLSGGEAQRIALARAILKDSPIVVLDEATAFADPENESQIQKAFDHLTKGKTVLMIAHRLSTIQNADNILVLDEGQVVEQGSHDGLLGKDGIYAAMWTDYQKSAQWKVGREAAI